MSEVARRATIDALLCHIGLDPDSPPPPTREGLRTVHRAYVSTVPYEALAVQLQETAPLDPDALAARVLTGRGGYCFEVNTVLHALLTALGFDVAMHQARVNPPGPTNHMALVVTHANGDRDIADAGLGEGSLDPLPLTAGTTGDPFVWRVEEREDGWWVSGHEWCSLTGFEIDRRTSALTDFDPHHTRLATDPESSFVRTLVVQRPTAAAILTLRARTLSSVSPAGTERSMVHSERNLRRTLSSVFGIPETALTDEQVARLWVQACEQHDRHAASPRAAPEPRLRQVPMAAWTGPAWGCFRLIGALDVPTTNALVERLGLEWELEVPELDHSSPFVALDSPRGLFVLEGGMLPIDADVMVRAQPYASLSTLRGHFCDLAALPRDAFSCVVEHDVWFERVGTAEA